MKKTPGRKIFVTGGAGFIGSNFIRYWISRHPQDRLTNFDALTYAGNPENLKSVEGHPRYSFVKGDITDSTGVRKALRGTDIVVHFAAETHVDRSIIDPSIFSRTNTLGVQTLLEEARKVGVKKFVHISTDEVFGSLKLHDRKKFKESTAYAPSSPYAASKAGGDMLVQAYGKTYNFPGIITHCGNNFGPYQYPEKFIPLMIIQALQGKALPIYGDGKYIRDWIYVEDHVRALEAVVEKGRIGERYCIGGEPKMNLEVARTILKILGKGENLLQFVPDRPGHDRKYVSASAKIKRDLKWRPLHTFEERLRYTIGWYQENQVWWRSLMNKNH
jgi:dTDP-glucose 4,6-dehydratase